MVGALGDTGHSRGVNPRGEEMAGMEKNRCQGIGAEVPWKKVVVFVMMTTRRVPGPASRLFKQGDVVLPVNGHDITASL